MNSWRIQGARFIIVGLVSNFLLYLLYLILTKIGFGYKIAMTLLYVLGVLQTFVFNKAWTFQYAGNHPDILVRYIIVYAFGYFFNLVLLMVFVDIIMLPHAIVQAVAIVLCGALIFFGQKLWVFSPGWEVSLESSGFDRKALSMNADRRVGS
ncbi:GtrA family protein [Imhoffiella purpurea]|uniref:GtrA family protein n=1 Tax=Imhoffiella purpurea TaxID=1249627 RepID=UPI00069484C8|nr:GtrA family protein [Imhoffiella purpurea]